MACSLLSQQNSLEVCWGLLSNQCAALQPAEPTLFYFPENCLQSSPILYRNDFQVVFSL